MASLTEDPDDRPTTPFAPGSGESFGARGSFCDTSEDQWGQLHGHGTPCGG